MNINLFLSKNKYTIFRYSPVVAISLIFIELLHLQVSDKPIQDFSPLVLYLICSLLLVFALFLLRLLFEAGTTVYGWWKNKREDEISYDDAIDTKLEIDEIEKFTKSDVKNDQLRLDVAINFAVKKFQYEISNCDLKKLKSLIKNYATGNLIKCNKPITTKSLTAKDIRAFGWSLWNHFRSNKISKEIFVEDYISWFYILKKENFKTHNSHFADDNCRGKIPKDTNLYEKYLPEKYKNKGNIKAVD